jgi:hypothetical protein
MSKIENPGRYAATVTEAEFGESQTGTPFLRLSLTSDEGAYIGAYLYLSEKALPGSVRTLRDAFAFNGDFETLLDQITGKPCSITVETEVYEGKERLRVKWINAERSTKPIDNQSAFLKALSAKAARIPKEAPKAGAAPTRSSPPPKAAAKATAPDEGTPF